jgi:GPI biosynthesis protein family Pig-F
MALDWDRDWQAWPVTVMVGCYGGWAMGKTLLGPVFLKDKRIDMSVGAESDALASRPDVKKVDKKSQ